MCTSIIKGKRISTRPERDEVVRRFDNETICSICLTVWQQKEQREGEFCHCKALIWGIYGVGRLHDFSQLARDTQSFRFCRYCERLHST